MRHLFFLSYEECISEEVQERSLDLPSGILAPDSDVAIQVKLYADTGAFRNCPVGIVVELVEAGELRGLEAMSRSEPLLQYAETRSPQSHVVRRAPDEPKLRAHFRLVADLG